MEKAFYKHKKFLIVFIILLLVIIIPGLLLVMPVLAWGPDQSITYRQALDSIRTLNWPFYGLINSNSFRNPNALVLLTIPFVLIFPSPQLISFFLSLVQVGLIYTCLLKLLRFHGIKPRPLELLPLLILFIFTPTFLITSAEIWAQYICRTLVFIMFVTALMLIKKTPKPSMAHSFILGFLCLFLPAIHLALAVILPFAAIYSYYLFHKRRLHLVSFMVGVILALLISWLPWVWTSLDFAMNMLIAKYSTEKSISLLTPFIYLYQIITSPTEGGTPITADIILSSSSQTLMKIFQYIKLVLLLILVLPITIFMIKRHRSKHRFFAFYCFGVILIAILMEIIGSSNRIDFLIMFQTVIFSVFLIIAIKTLRWISFIFKMDKWLKTGLLLLNVILITLSLTVLFNIREDNLKPHPFSLADTPLYEKTQMVENLISHMKPYQKIDVGVKIRNYKNVFGFILFFNRIDMDNYYRPEIFYETCLKHKKCANNFKFIDPVKGPDYLILANFASPQTFQLETANGSKAKYQLISVTPHLGFYEKKSLASHRN